MIHQVHTLADMSSLVKVLKKFKLKTISHLKHQQQIDSIIQYGLHFGKQTNAMNANTAICNG